MTAATPTSTLRGRLGTSSRRRPSSSATLRPPRQPLQAMQPPEQPAPAAQPPSPQKAPPPTPAQIEQVARLIERMTKHYYDLRFRLNATGAARTFAARLEELSELLEQLTSAIDRDATPRELNRIATKHGVAMCFAKPRPNYTLVYQVTVQLDGSLAYDLPHEAGGTLAHRRLGDKLLRVRFAPIAKGASKAEKASREELRRRMVRGDSGLLKVADRRFHHFAHKDAEKKEESSSLWFVAIPPHDPKRPGRSVQHVNGFRDKLLDTRSWKDGDEAKGKLDAAKLNARLTLAFSTTISVEACRPTERSVLDWRKWPWTWESLLVELGQRKPVAAGRVQLVIVDDLQSGEESEAVMTDGAGMIAHNLAKHIPPCSSGKLVDETPGAALLAHGVPLLSQVRIWHRGYVAKGMLLADAELPDGYIVMCASMVKIFGRKDCALSNGLKNNPKSRDKTPETSAFEVIRTSNDSVRADGPSLEPARRLQRRCTSHPLSRGL